MHLIAMIIGFILGGSLLSAAITMLLGYSSTYELGWMFMFICGCICAGVAQVIASKISKIKEAKKK